MRHRWMGFWVVLLLVVGTFAPPTWATHHYGGCRPSDEDEAAFEAATPRLMLAGLSPVAIALGIGLDGHFYLTRASVTTMAVGVLGWRAEIESFEGPYPFEDVPADHWGAPYIAVAAREGLVKGDPDGSFRPDQEVTPAEVRLILARLLRAPGELTLENAGEKLMKMGVDPGFSCESDDEIDWWQVLLLIDRAMSTPIHQRWSKEAP